MLPSKQPLVNEARTPPAAFDLHALQATAGLADTLSHYENAVPIDSQSMVDDAGGCCGIVHAHHLESR